MRILVIAGVVLVTCGFGFFSYAALISYASYQHLLSLSIEMCTDFSGLGVRYGTLVSKDVGARTIVIESPYESGTIASMRILTLSVPEDTLILEQTLLLDPDGSYGTLSTSTSASLADIPNGARLRVYISDLHHTLTASLIVFGDPL